MNDSIQKRNFRCVLEELVRKHKEDEEHDDKICHALNFRQVLKDIRQRRTFTFWFRTSREALDTVEGRAKFFFEYADTLQEAESMLSLLRELYARGN